MNTIVYYYQSGERATLEEAKETTDEKAERAKNKPKKPKDWKPDDIEGDVK